MVVARSNLSRIMVVTTAYCCCCGRGLAGRRWIAVTCRELTDIPAEEQEVRTGAQRRDNNENILVSEGTRRTARNHQYDNAVGQEQHRLGRT